MGGLNGEDEIAAASVVIYDVGFELQRSFCSAFNHAMHVHSALASYGSRGSQAWVDFLKFFLLH